MARLTVEARRQLGALTQHYQDKARFDATRRLREALATAMQAADNPRTRWRSAPTSYPEVASAGYLWLKQHRYWFACSTAPDGEGIIHAILFDAANIPARLPLT